MSILPFSGQGWTAADRSTRAGGRIVPSRWSSSHHRGGMTVAGARAVVSNRGGIGLVPIGEVVREYTASCCHRTAGGDDRKRTVRRERATSWQGGTLGSWRRARR